MSDDLVEQCLPELRSVVFALAVITGVLIVGSGSVRTTQSLTVDLIQDTVESLAAVVEQEYFDPSVGAAVAQELRQRLGQDLYRDVSDVDALAERLTGDLLSLTEDRHLAVAVVDRSPVADANPPAAGNDSRQAQARRANAGVRRVEILPGNVGYLDLTSFFRPNEARAAIAAAMQLLQHAQVLILDMRHNGGGSPGTVALLLSYFFDEPAVPLFEVAPRPPGEVTRYETTSPALPERDATRPLYVLTAPGTFSAGEGFAFILQERGRAEVVGEQTAGAANPGRPYAINASFEVTVPNGHVRTAVTGRNWEGAGVTPDIAVPAADALRTAHQRAIRAVLEETPPGRWRDTLLQTLQELETSGR